MTSQPPMPNPSATQTKTHPEPPSAAVGWTTTATREEADALARGLLEQRLIACAQVSGPIVSHYVWQGESHADEEFRVTLKFPESLAPRIEAWLDSNHPYEVPQWLWTRMHGVSASYLRWMLDSTQP